jgi:hypothetical protein
METKKVLLTIPLEVYNRKKLIQPPTTWGKALAEGVNSLYHKMEVLQNGTQTEKPSSENILKTTDGILSGES